jgi:hypothetical protein
MSGRRRAPLSSILRAIGGGSAVAVAVAACTPFKEDGLASGVSSSPVDAGDAACDPRGRFGAPRRVPGLTGIATSVGGLRLSPDGLTGYFSALDGPEAVGGNDLYSATRDSVTSPFDRVVPLTGVNTAKDELNPTVPADGSILVFERTMPGPANPIHLYGATAVSDLPFELRGQLAINDPSGDDRSPFVVAGGSALYFASTRGGPQTGLFVAARQGSDFASARSIDELDGPYVTLSPVVSPDELTIYFASNRTDGAAVGDFDVWRATRGSTAEAFAELTDVSEVNSTNVDLPTFATGDGCALYLTSGRDGTLEMYLATRAPGAP